MPDVASDAEPGEEEQREPGWYRDPFAAAGRRWWDGTRWTELAEGGGEVRWDASGLASFAPPAPGLPGLWVAATAWALGVVATVAVAAALERDRSDPTVATVLLPSLALWLPLVVACVLVWRRRGSGSFAEDFALRFRRSDVLVGIGASISARLLVAVAYALVPVPGQRHRLEDLDRDFFDLPEIDGPTWLALFLVVCVGAPLVEELFFRGLLQPRLVGRLGPVVGIGLSSLLFGAAHLLGWAGPYSLLLAWSIGAAGLVLGVLRHVTGRLGPAITTHVAFNLLAFGVQFLLLR